MSGDVPIMNTGVSRDDPRDSGAEQPHLNDKSLVGNEPEQTSVGVPNPTTSRLSKKKRNVTYDEPSPYVLVTTKSGRQTKQRVLNYTDSDDYDDDEDVPHKRRKISDSDFQEDFSADESPPSTLGSTDQLQVTEHGDQESENLEFEDTNISDKHKDRPRPRIEKLKLGQLPTRSALHRELAPIHCIDEIFKDITTKAYDLGLEKALKHLGNRPLRVATMCSGTESPLLALSMVQDISRTLHGRTFKFSHLFSAEIVPFKQAYIERNFGPPILFKDITELTETHGTTAYGAKVAIPGDADLLIAGSSCVDYSALNTARKTSLNEVGESADTSNAILRYADNWRPKMVLLENLANAPWKELKTKWENLSYSAFFVKLDTKDYYLPQTRQRGYMICVDRKVVDQQFAEKICHQWGLLMTGFKRPVSSSLEEFLLPELDGRVQRARLEMSSAREFRDNKWAKSKARHNLVRQEFKLGRKRPYTGWQEDGSCRLPDYAWNEWCRKQVSRVQDALDIHTLRGIARGYDTQYRSRIWDLSQNVDRFSDVTSPGLSGCITPSGIPFSTIRGGPLVGEEILSLQGIPIDRLLLTRETYRELQDLAGNAMSTTVIGSSILSALIAGHEVLPDGSEYAVEEDRHVTPPFTADTEGMISVDMRIDRIKEWELNHILDTASQTKALCLCEGQDSVTATGIQRCRECGHTTCKKCTGNPKHDYELFPSNDKLRKPPTEFEKLIKAALPMKICLTGMDVQLLEALKSAHRLSISSDLWPVFVHGIEPALEAELRFHSIVRGWTVHYDSYRARMELVLDQGHVEWRLFAKPAAQASVNSTVRQILAQPFARMRPSGSDLLKGTWQLCLPIDHSFIVQIKANGSLRPSWELAMGLKELPEAKQQAWTHLKVSVTESARQYLEYDISGTYLHLPECGMASGSLHKQISGGTTEPVFFFLDPDPHGHPVDDYFVFSTDKRRPGPKGWRPVIARLDRSFRLGSGEEPQSVNGTIDGYWVDCEKVELVPGRSHNSIRAMIPSRDMLDASPNGCTEPKVILSCKFPITKDQEACWTRGPWKIIDATNQVSVFSSLAWITERAPSPCDRYDWQNVNIESMSQVCRTCAPKAPPSRWKLDNNRFIPYEDPELAGDYERSLKNRPSAFESRVRVTEDEFGQLVITLNLATLFHRAIDKVPSNGGCSEFVQAAWRFDTGFRSSLQLMKLPDFSIPNNKSDSKSSQPPNWQIKETTSGLRPEQLRSLNWMIGQESADALPFLEEEIEEAIIPEMHWRAEARATWKNCIYGGVLADEVGYGKTALILGLIDTQFSKEQKEPQKEFNGKICVGATLILVPYHLVHQWEKETKKFLGTTYNILAIQTVQQLSKLSVQDIIAADIIILSWEVLIDDGYLNNLAYFAAIPQMPSNPPRAFDTWFDYASGRAFNNLQALRQTGSVDFDAYLISELEKLEGDEQFYKHCPSKRLRGAAFVQNRTKQGTIAARARASAAKGTRSRTMDPFGFKLNNADRDWTQMNYPLLQLFHFNRLVVDEYTYPTGRCHTSITKLSATRRWMLSGTPPIADFTDIKTIASFLGIHLGVLDYSKGAVQLSKYTQMLKESTDVEKFHYFRQTYSNSWHEQRNLVAQRFLDKFVRQNDAELPVIEQQMHFIPVVLPSAEYSLYLELLDTVLSVDMNVPKLGKRQLNHRDASAQAMLENSETAEEALLKRASLFRHDYPHNDPATTTTLFSPMILQRMTEYNDQLRQLRTSLKKASWLYHDYRVQDLDEHYDRWKNDISGGSTDGDPDVRVQVLSSITDAKTNYNENDWTHFFRDGTAEQFNSTKETEMRLKALRKRVIKNVDTTESSDSEPTDKMDLDEQKLIRPTTAEDKKDFLRHVATIELGGICTRLVSCMRALRYLRAFEKIHTMRNAMSSIGHSDNSITCERCKSSLTRLEDVLLLSVCGHICCTGCLKAFDSDDGCVVSGCDVATKDFHVKRGSDLSTDIVLNDTAISSGPYFGAKLERLIEIIQQIPPDEQALLFVPWESTMAAVAECLQFHGISHINMAKHAKNGSSGRKASQMVKDLDRFRIEREQKVLILNAADSSAAGINLANANHVIFLSPLFAQSRQMYLAQYRQAVGRCRRFPQDRIVHVYDILAIKTIDVDLYEVYTKKQVVRDGGSYKLMDGPNSDVDPSNLDVDLSNLDVDTSDPDLTPSNTLGSGLRGRFLEIFE